MRRISKKQVRELALRRRLKAELIAESEGLCMRCGRKIPLDLVHIIPLSRGGKTERDNLIVVCRVCHAPDHGLRV
jgi:5-methylcytosine-specific restriction endonuclease McrA